MTEPKASRRTTLATAAWTAPVVVGVSAAPAYANSQLMPNTELNLRITHDIARHSSGVALGYVYYQLTNNGRVRAPMTQTHVWKAGTSAEDVFHTGIYDSPPGANVIDQQLVWVVQFSGLASGASVTWNTRFVSRATTDKYYQFRARVDPVYLETNVWDNQASVGFYWRP